MRIGHVSHADFPPPQNNPPMGAAASHHVLTSVGDIAALIASGGARSVGATSAVSSAGDIPTLNADLQVYADLAEIDLYLHAHPGQTTFNDPFLAGIIANMKAQSGTCDGDAKTLITAAQKTFTASGNTVTFSTTGTQTFSTFWTTSTTGGLATVIADLASKIAGSGLQPSVKTASQPNAPDTPGVLVNLALIYADAMIRSPSLTSIIDKSFFGASAAGATIAQTLPYAIVAYEYQMEFNEAGGAGTWAAVDKDVQNILSLLPTPASIGIATPNYAAMYNLFTQNPTEFTNIQSFTAWGALGNIFFNNPSDLSGYYGDVLDPLYNKAMNPPNH